MVGCCPYSPPASDGIWYRSAWHARAASIGRFFLISLAVHVNITLNYGRGGLEITLPSGVSADVVRKPAMPVLVDPQAAVVDALSARTRVDAPKRIHSSGQLQEPTDDSLADSIVGTDRFSWANGCKSACIAICDITRPVPNHLFLRPIIEVLLDQGMDRQDITVLLATGLHRPNEGKELEELVGDSWVLENIQIKKK